MNILLIDDDLSCLRSLSYILESFGHKCDNFTNPLEAIESYKIKKHDLIITDVIMEQMSGIGLLKEIHSINSNSKVIILTAYNEEDIISNTFDNKAFAFFTKPLDFNRFMDIISEI